VRTGQEAQAEADDDPRRESVYPHLRCAPATARRGTDADHFTLGLRKRSFGIVMLLLALVAMAPGVSIVAGLLLMIPAFQMNAGQPAPVFPRRIAARPFSTRHLAALVPRAVPVLRYLEKVIHPRWPTPLEATKRLVGIVVVILNTTLVFTPIPLSNVVPALVIHAKKMEGQILAERSALARMYFWMV
jgi:Exopolysaccharide synthesis, ExoD